jgi:hypothetical protein
LNGSASVSVCSECGSTWPARFGAGAATVRIVSKRREAEIRGEYRGSTDRAFLP